ncbi:MAG: CRISPR-associated endonuclease Cas1 [Candidatus Thorarchaeota archaeon]|nr:CRISPR-associated endonuclease Cas1 [Candidatus Thorarchaeota archaeon]
MGFELESIILDEFGLFLGKKGERFVVKKSGKALAEFPVSEVERIIISSAGVSVSSAALYLAVVNRVQIAFTYSSGKPFGFLTPVQGHGTVITRRAQYLEAESAIATRLVLGFIRGKLANQRNLLKSWAKNRTRTSPETSDYLFAQSKRVDTAIKDLVEIEGRLTGEIRQTIMNIEGRAAQSYWEGVAKILPPELGFTGRETRGARDPMNMLFNYGYGVLYTAIWSAVTIAGLDPFAGFLHVDRPGRPSLVLDLIEEFRQQIVDRPVIAVVIRGSLPPREIIAEGELSKLARQNVAKSVIERLDERVTYDDSKISLKNVIQRQAWMVVKVLRRQKDKYDPFIQRW